MKNTRIKLNVLLAVVVSSLTLTACGGGGGGGSDNTSQRIPGTDDTPDRLEPGDTITVSTNVPPADKTYLSERLSILTRSQLRADSHTATYTYTLQGQGKASFTYTFSNQDNTEISVTYKLQFYDDDDANITGILLEERSTATGTSTRQINGGGLFHID